MAAGIPARLTAAQGRRSGLAVGGAFLLFAAIAWWWGHPTTMTVLATLGGLLCVAGLAIPTFLGPVERAWTQLAYLVSKVTTQIVKGAICLLVLTPVGFLRCMFGGNPMAHVAHNVTYWKSRPEGRGAGNLSR